MRRSGTVLWPELEQLVTSNNLRKKLETLQTGVEREFSSQEIPVFRLILEVGKSLFQRPQEIERLKAAFPAILSGTYEGSEATPLGHERSYNEARILDGLKSAGSAEAFCGAFAPKATQVPPPKPLFRRIVAAEVDGGFSTLCNEQDRYEASLRYRSRDHLGKILKRVGIDPVPLSPAEQRSLRNTCQEIVGIPDMAQPGFIRVLDLPVRVFVDGNPAGSGTVRLMIIESEVPSDRSFSLPERIRELDRLLADL